MEEDQEIFLKERFALYFPVAFVAGSTFTRRVSPARMLTLFT
jgi:hypothetical protein